MFNFIVSKMTPSQANNMIINAFEYIQYVNIYKEVWVYGGTLFRHITHRLPFMVLTFDVKLLSRFLPKSTKEILIILLNPINRWCMHILLFMLIVIKILEKKIGIITLIKSKEYQLHLF